MKITVNSSVVKNFIKVSRAKKISMITNNNNLVLTSREKNTGIIYINDDVDIKESGNICIKKEIFDYIDNNILLNIEDTNITYDSNKIKYMYTEMEQDFTSILNSFKSVTTIPKKLFDDMTGVGYATSKNETRPILQCLYFKGDEVAASDGYRMAIRKFDIDMPEFLIPNALIKFYKKISLNTKNIEIVENSFEIGIKINNYIIFVKKIEGNYIKYKSLITDTYKTMVELDTEKILPLLKKAKKNDYVKLDIKDNNIKFIINNDKFTVENNFECIKEGDDLEIYFNPNYLLEALNNYNKPTLKFNVIPKPVTITEGNKTEIVSPMRVNE